MTAITLTSNKSAIAKQKARLVPELLCQLLSPYPSKSQVEATLTTLLADEELLDLTIELANSRFMTATLYTQLKTHTLEHLLPEALNVYLVEMTRFMKARGKALVELVEEIVTISNQHNITPLLMKGSSSLFSDVYLEKDIRFMSDLDILYKPEDALTIFKVLQEKGFYIPEKYFIDGKKPRYLNANSTVDDLPSDQHLLPLYRKNAPCGLEIHFRPLHHAYRYYLDTNTAFESSSTIEKLSRKGMTVQRMSPENEVIYCFAHSEIAHGFYQGNYLDLRQMDFFVRLIYCYKEVINWDQIHSRIKQAGGEVVFQHYLYAVNQLFATNYPLTVTVVETHQLEQHYQWSIKSCFQRYHFKWRLQQFIKENVLILGKDKMHKLYTIDSKMSLLLARVNFIGVLLKRYSHPTMFIRRFKLAFKRFHKRALR
jgi:hypothetical protein